jgi:hypothetical protein
VNGNQKHERQRQYGAAAMLCISFVDAATLVFWSPETLTSANGGSPP